MNLTHAELLALSALRPRDKRVKAAIQKIEVALTRRIHDRKRNADWQWQRRN